MDLRLPQVIAHIRRERKQEFDVAERVLRVGWVSVTNTQVEHPSGDRRAGLILLGLYAKILNNLASIIALEEHALPTASVMREMTEALINLVEELGRTIDRGYGKEGWPAPDRL
jgi:hypothetical protein